MELSQNWLLMAFLTPLFWAMGCLLDSCLVGQRIYKVWQDGAIISCLFCAFPALFVFGFNPEELGELSSSSDFPVSAVLAGLSYAVHLFLFYRILFQLNDVSGAETFLALSVLIVPFLAWLILDEVLPARFYFAFLLAGIGVFVQCLPAIRRIGVRLVLKLIACVTTVSLSIVLQSVSLHEHGWAKSIVAFNLTCFLIALLFLFAHKEIRQRILSLCRVFPLILLVSELLDLTAVLSLHRASQYAPSISYVALIECLLPLVIIAISYLIVTINRYTPLLSDSNKETLTLQIAQIPGKMFAITLLLLSVATVSF